MARIGWLRYLASVPVDELADAATTVRDEATPSERTRWLKLLAERDDLAPAAADVVLPFLLDVTAVGADSKQAAAEALAATGDVAALADATAAGNTAATQRAAIHGLTLVGTVDAVDALVPMLGDAYLSEIRRDAARGLRTMLAGLDGPLDLDISAWQQWAQTQDDRARLADVLRRASQLRLRQAATGREDLASRLEAFARDRYTATPAEERPALLEAWLCDPAAPVRLAAGRIVLDNLSFGDLPSETAMRAVRINLTDPEPAARVLFARIVRDRGEESADDLLLSRLFLEPLADVRLDLLDLVAPTADAQDSGTLLQVMRQDGSSLVRLRAADLAARVAAASDDLGLLRRTKEALLATADDAPDVATELAYLRALAKLPDASLTRLWVDRLAALGQDDAANSIRIEIALSGLAASGDARVADVPVSYLRHPELSVRVAAVRALAATGGFARMARLEPLFDPPPGQPRDAAGDAAREAFLDALPAADVAALASWPDRLQDAALRLAVVTELAERARAAGDIVRLGFRLQERAELLSDRVLDRPAESAAAYEEALRLELDRQDAAADGQDTRGLSVTASALTRAGGAMSGYLLAGSTADARRLATMIVERRPSMASDVGAMVRRSVNALIEAGRPDEARRVIEDVLTWDPPLDDLNRRRLAEQATRLAN